MTEPTSFSFPAQRGDRGSVLPLVLVFSVVLSMVVVALATYASATVRSGQVAEDSSDRLSSANGAMDSALEDIERGVSPCLLFGQDYTVTDSVNGMSSEVDCTWPGGRFKVGDLFAVVMTGEGAGRTGPLLTVTNGGASPQAEKIFEGPVYMADTPTDVGANPTLDIRANFTSKNADLAYSAADCGTATPSLPGALTISPVGYGTQCYDNLPWDDTEMFGSFQPPEPTVTNPVAFPIRSSVAPPPDALGCHIWPAGRYNSPPLLANQSYNYYQSGDYYLRNTGEWAINQAFVLFGYPGATGPSIDGPRPQDTFTNNPCRDAWANEPNPTGATLYLGGNSQIVVDQNATVEISGRDHGGHNVGLQALENQGMPSTIEGEARILRTGPGSNKQLSIQGLVWAPNAALEFDLIANEAVAALTGGAVVSELSAGAAANASNFTIRVLSSPATKTLRITTSATNSGTTQVRAVVTVQRSQGATAYALRSRRVLGLAAE